METYYLLHLCLRLFFFLAFVLCLFFQLVEGVNTQGQSRSVETNALLGRDVSGRFIFYHSQCGWDVEITTEMKKQFAALKCIKCISCQSKYLLERKSMWKGVVSGKDLGEQVRRMLQAVLEVMRMRNSSRKRLAENVVMNGRKNVDGGQCCKNFVWFLFGYSCSCSKMVAVWVWQLDWQHVGQPRGWSAVRDKTFTGYLNPYTIHL